MNRFKLLTSVEVADTVCLSSMSTVQAAPSCLVKPESK